MGSRAIKYFKKYWPEVLALTAALFVSQIFLLAEAKVENGVANLPASTASWLAATSFLLLAYLLGGFLATCIEKTFFAVLSVIELLGFMVFLTSSLHEPAPLVIRFPPFPNFYYLLGEILVGTFLYLRLARLSAGKES